MYMHIRSNSKKDDVVIVLPTILPSIRRKPSLVEYWVWLSIVMSNLTSSIR